MGFFYYHEVSNVNISTVAWGGFVSPLFFFTESLQQPTEGLLKAATLHRPKLHVAQLFDASCSASLLVYIYGGITVTPTMC